ncbi:unnamed protein product [Adineta steineri]|uniref:Innexin n=1 Tax=Adineta steineri TaxID=433720 RepID=A0A818IR92_9BILA|nr:unnamed protein product [Adineta steineri]CAF1081398.1 unnamed protein product [Adineta steineri]CAF3527132.1 unnamed protein product [Adineta steineri]CAF3563101.1 unnamed protein product [Adineta steineri]
MAVFLVDAAAKVGQHGHDGACDDDFYDRLSRRYSVILLVIFTILVSSKQYVGEPIACFCPAHFTGTHVEYTNNICWISNTYFVSFDRLLPKYPDPKTEHFIYFYQYVPFILMIQAILFYVPSIIWSTLNSKSGYDLGMLVTQARMIDTYTADIRAVSVRHLARYIDRTLEYHKQKRLEYMNQLQSVKCSSFFTFCMYNNHITMRDNHLMWSFLFTKILYLINAFGQLYLLNFFLGNNYHMYGFAVIHALFTGNNENWTITPRFPRVTWCNFAVRNMADNIHTYTVQCSLPINLFNEKIFLLIWFWLYFTTLFTLFGFIYWVVSFFYPQFYRTNILHYLSSMKRINIHHFPQNPFEEQMHHQHHHRHHSHHHHFRHHHHNQSHHRAYSFAAHHMQNAHMQNAHHQNLLSPFAGRSMKASFDSNRSLRSREQISIPIPVERDTIESPTPSTADEHSSTASTPQRLPTNEPDIAPVSADDNQLITNFLVDYLGRDGALVLYILKINSNDVITGEIVTALFELFKTTYHIDRTE